MTESHNLMNAVTRFQYDDGSHMPLSNFYKHTIHWRGHDWPTNEHAFQAAKCVPDDPTFNLIWAAKTPGDAKRLGRKCQLRPDWEQVKLAVMRELLELKFPDDGPLTTWLDSTENALLVEGNTWGDRFWGVDTSDWTGENWLGHLLMARRAEIRAVGS